MKFEMNLYYDPMELIGSKRDFRQDVLARLNESDKSDLYRVFDLEVAYDEQLESALVEYSVEQLSSYLTVDILSIVFDKGETECMWEDDSMQLAYSITCDFDFERLRQDITSAPLLNGYCVAIARYENVLGKSQETSVKEEPAKNPIYQTFDEAFEYARQLATAQYDDYSTNIPTEPCAYWELKSENDAVRVGRHKLHGFEPVTDYYVEHIRYRKEAS